MTLPLQHITMSVSGVTFPALSKMQHDKEEVRDAYSKMLLLISMVTFPILIGLAVLAPELVTIVLGDKWSPAITVVQILCVAGLFQSIGSSYPSMMLSQGRADLLFKVGLFSGLIVCVAIASGLALGINGVATCYTLAIIFLFPIEMYFTLRLIGLKLRPFLRALLPAISLAVAMLVFLLAFRHISEAIWKLPKIVFLLSSIVLGATTYTALLRIVFPEEFKEMCGVIRIAVS
jgi:PST family polysaccharide transporter